MELVKRPKIVVIGEGMLELSRSDDRWAVGFGGDTLNTAIHLARTGLDVGFLTALGADAFSSELRSAWAGEGLDTTYVLTDPSRQPGLYAIRLDSDGERTFAYWRGQSAAREMFDLSSTAQALGRAASADLLIFSLISLAILPEEGREHLLGLAKTVRANGSRVAFDGNYRPKLWESPEAARIIRSRALQTSDFGFPTLEDEFALAGNADARDVAADWTAQGVTEVVVKLGNAGCLAADELVPPPIQLIAVDTSGAGDSFNAGYLAARLAGSDPVHSALAGHRLAAWVIGRRGAIPALDQDAPYSDLCARLA